MRFRKFRPKYSPFTVITSGGAATQLMGLINGLQISLKHNRPFVIKHYSRVTGGYYPCALTSLLSEQELVVVQSSSDDKNISVGTLFENAKVKNNLRDRIILFLQKLNLDNLFYFFRGTWQVDGSLKRLMKAPRNLKVLSPTKNGYVPFCDENISKNIENRFRNANLPNIVSGAEKKEVLSYMVVHVRLGDKRNAFHRPDLGGSINGIVSPESYKSLISIYSKTIKHIYLISDDFETAIKLLKEYGINVMTKNRKGDLWYDMELMANAEVVIGPWSTVPMVSAIINHNSKTLYFLPEQSGNGFEIDWTWKPGNLQFYKPVYLPGNHWIYTADSDVSKINHSIYSN